MHRFQKVVLGTAVAALAAASIGAPVAAADTARLTIVNGIPGKSAEVCVGTKEVKRKLGYGGATVRVVSPGTKVVRLRKPSAGTCKGALIAKKPVAVVASDDLTVVFSKKAPVKIRVFDNNAGTGPDWSTTSKIQIYNMSDIDAPGFKYMDPDGGTAWFPTGPASTPAADTPWVKGQAGWGVTSVDTDRFFWAHKTPIQTPIGTTHVIKGEANTLYQFILVGTSAANAKYVKVKTSYPFGS